jgi:hypothetical protein
MSGPALVATLSNFQPIGYGSREVRLALTHSHLPPPFVAGGTVRPFTGYQRPPATMPSADFSPTIGANRSAPSHLLVARDYREGSGEISRGTSGYFRRTIVSYRGSGHKTDGRLRRVLPTRLSQPPPHLPAPATPCRLDIPVRRPASLPEASFRRASLRHPCLRLPFASV